MQELVRVILDDGSTDEALDPRLAEPDAIRAEYRRRFDAFLNEVQGHCQARGCDWYLAKTTDNPYAFLRNCFLAREMR